MDLNLIIPTAVNHGLQLVLSVMWIVVLGAILKNAPKFANRIIDLVVELKSTLKENSELLIYTKDLHNKMAEIDEDRHTESMSSLSDIACDVKKVREAQTIQTEEDAKKTIALERIEKALTAIAEKEEQ